MRRQIFIMYKHNPIWFVLDQNLPSKLKSVLSLGIKWRKKIRKLFQFQFGRRRFCQWVSVPCFMVINFNAALCPVLPVCSIHLFASGAFGHFPLYISFVHLPHSFRYCPLIFTIFVYVCVLVLANIAYDRCLVFC